MPEILEPPDWFKQEVVKTEGLEYIEQTPFEFCNWARAYLDIEDVIPEVKYKDRVTPTKWNILKLACNKYLESVK